MSQEPSVPSVTPYPGKHIVFPACAQGGLEHKIGSHPSDEQFKPGTEVKLISQQDE